MGAIKPVLENTKFVIVSRKAVEQHVHVSAFSALKEEPFGEASPPPPPFPKHHTTSATVT